MTILVTGCAGFIGSQVALALLRQDRPVLGVDNLNAYYDVALKQARLARLETTGGFQFRKLDVADREAMLTLVAEHRDIEGVLHLASQAGVRHSLKNPYSYVETNAMGQLVVIEACRRLERLRHLVYASSSSVYGANEKLPFAVEDRVDEPASLYAATKRAGELIAHCYAGLYGLPVTGLRYFTVYGPWGRPDMAAYIFTKAIFEGRPVQLFNHGYMRRDFTYIDDVVAGTLAALEHAPAAEGDQPPHRLYNLGNHRAEELRHFLEVLEQACGRRALVEEVEMQPGDVPTTYADIEASQRDLGFAPQISIEEGLPRFVAWYRAYHGV